jgi:hypothetical protein
MNAQIKEVNTALVEFNEFESKLAEFKNQYDGVVYDLTDPKQDKKARSDKYAIAKVISALDDRHKELKAPLKERVDMIDGARKRIKDQLLEVQEKIKSQIETHEAQIKAKEDAILQRITAIRNLAIFGEFEKPNSGELTARLNNAKSVEIDDSFESQKAYAALAQTETVKLLEKLLADRIQYESEQAELERLRKETAERERADREEKIRAEAAENAKRIAEEAARREREEADLKAQQEIIEAQRKQKEAEEAAKRAEQKAKDDAEKAVKAERERAEREQKAAAEKAEQERIAEEAKKAKLTHRAKIHKEAKQSFIDAGLDEKSAESVVTMIKDGLIKNVSIAY